MSRKNAALTMPDKVSRQKIRTLIDAFDGASGLRARKGGTLMKRMISVVLLLACCLLPGQERVHATEGAGSYFFPGAFATFAAAMTPDPGFLVANQMLFYSAKADKAVLNGRVDLNLEADAFYNYFGGFYTFAAPILGSRLQVGAALPVGYVDMKASISTVLGSREISDSSFKLGDAMISSALFWKRSDFYVKLVETVFLPTGDYSTDNLANIGRNYWAFDTSGALTWLNMKTGTEISVMPGIMFNTKNSKTEYRSGNEFHVDFMVNQFLAANFALGVQGYYYSQVSGDSGSGARLGSFKGEALGFGPALLWMPKFGKGKLSLIAKWLHDVDHKNRIEGDYGQIVVGYTF